VSSKIKVLQFSYPRTGSTIIWHILDYLFSDQNNPDIDRWAHPLNIKKTHDINLLKKFASQQTSFDWCVITMRDPYQTAISVLRTQQKGNFNKIETIQLYKSQVITQFQRINESYTTIFNILKNKNKKFILLDYKDIEDIKKILIMFEEKFMIDIPDKKKLITKFSKESMLKVSHKYKSFGSYDKKTLIHGNHINTQPFYPQILENHPEYKKALNIYDKLHTYIKK
jgi:hypothetical protein